MWNNFSISTSDEETVNNALCASGLFKIFGDDKVTQHPRVQASVENKKMVISIDKRIILLEDENVAKCSFLSFKSCIDSFVISQSGNLIICALSDGDIHGVFIKGIPVFNLSVKAEDVSENNTFIGVQRNGRDYYIACNNGAVYRLMNVDESDLDNLNNDSFRENETYPFEETMMQNVSLERMVEGNLSKDLTAFTMVSQKTTNETYTLIAGSQNVIQFSDSCKSENIRVYLPDTYQGLKYIYNLEHYIIGLSNSGLLFQICPQIKLIFNIFHENIDYAIDDLIVMENSKEAIELLILTKADSNGKRLMKLIDFPSFNCNYELSLPNHVWLVSQPRNSVNVYYLSGENSNEFDLPQEIEMRLISETQPEQRLKKLIQKGHLNEAEEFGKQYGLSLQPIYEAKARRMLLEIQSITDENEDEIERKFLELIKVLKLIKNKEFFMAIRSVELPSRTITSQFLEEMLNHLSDDKYQVEILEIKEQQLRLETLNIIDPYECNLEWQKFIHHPSMVNVCTSLFKKDILSACLIWKRHAATIIPYLDENIVMKILNLLPQNAELFQVIQWLKHFIPSILQIYPKSMPFLVEWNEQKIRSLQYSNHWPEIGLEFATNVEPIFEDVNFLHSDIGRQYESCMEKIRSLVHALQDLFVLKKSYNLILTLDNYLKDSIDDSALHILQRVQINNLQKLVNDFLFPIYMEKGQSPNQAIIKYINFLVTNRNGISFWLDRAVASIDLLYNEEEKLLHALLVLKCTPVPWPEVVTPLIKLRCSSHPLATEISTECELQVIKIIKVKYGWPADSTDSNLRLVFRIVKIGLPEMIQDIKDVIKAAPEISTSANFYCCEELVRRAKIEKAIEFLSSLEDKQQRTCIEKTFNIFLKMLEDDDPENIENIIEFMKCISQRFNKNNQTEFLNLLNINILRNNFSLQINTQDLKDMRRKIFFLQKGCEQIIANLNDISGNVVDNVWYKICQLSVALNVEKVVGIIEFSKQLKNIHFTCALAYNILELTEITTANCSSYIDLSALLIFQQIEFYIDGKSDVVDPLAYPLAYKILVESLKLGKIYQLEIIELLQWVRIGNNLYRLTELSDYYLNSSAVEENVRTQLNGNSTIFVPRKNKRESILVFEQVFDSKETVKQSQNNVTPVLKCVSYCLLMILLELNPKESGLERIALFSESSKYNNSTQDLKKMFFETLEHLIKSKHSSWYVILQYILKYQEQHGNFNIIHETFVSTQLKKMLQYLLTQKEPNFIELFSMLICDCNPRSCLEYIGTKLKSGQQKINLLMLSEMYNTHVGNLEEITSNRERRMKYYYYIELCKQDPSLKNKSDIEFVSINQIMKELRNKLLDVSLLEKLSRDFDWDYQQALVSQVISVLNLQEPLFEIKVDALGKEELVMKVNVDQIRQLCEPYINEITNSELLVTRLLHFIKEINFYFYELYLCVVDILTCINALPKEMEFWKDILLFLKHKMTSKRRQRAGQIETDWWLKSQLEVGVLPKIAKYRFPFIPLVQEPLENILDSEVNADNCVSWFPLIKLGMALQGTTLNSDIIRKQEYFCMSAVKNSTSEYKQQNEDVDTDVWHIHPLNNAFLQSILRLVSHMSDLSRILFILYFVTNHARDGADQVDAAYECYKFAVKYEKELLSNEKAREIVIKIKRKYPIFKTQHLLHVYGLIEDKLLQLVENPRELINDLYHHELVLKPNKPDINKVASEIAALHGLDFDILQKGLLQKWLAFALSSNIPDLEDTFYEDLNTTVTAVDDINDEFVLRAHYILASWNPKKAMDFLIYNIYPIDGVINTSQQLQMFECFSKLVNESNLSYGDIVNQKEYVVTKCVHYLKQLGYNFTIEKFSEYDKLTILKKVWQNHANNSQALEIISHICMGFDIFIPQIWNGVLKQMVQLNMVKQLNALVDVLSCKLILLNTDGLMKAWECVLRDPFKSANRTRSNEQETVLHKNLLRIQSCPLVGKLNLIEIAEDCMRLDRPHMASILIVFCNVKQKDTIRMMVKQHKGITNLQKEILDLQDVGILPTITNSVLRYLNL